MTGEREAVVYFVKAGSAIKIGYTTDLPARLKNLAWAQSEALTVVGIKLGGRAEEKELHRRLAAHRLNGEWFKDCDEVRAAIGEGLTIEIERAAKPYKPPGPVKERKLVKRREFHIELPPAARWPELSKRIKALDDGVFERGTIKQNGLVLHRALTEFTSLFERYLIGGDETAELFNQATSVVEQAERELAA